MSRDASITPHICIPSKWGLLALAYRAATSDKTRLEIAETLATWILEAEEQAA